MPSSHPRPSIDKVFDARQLDFVANDLARVPADQLVVLMMHIPLTAAFDAASRPRLFRLLEPRPPTLSISAHNHAHEHRFLTREDGWRGPEPHHHMITITTCGSWWTGAPDETGIPRPQCTTARPTAGRCSLSFDGHDYTVDFRAARRPAEEQMLIWAPEMEASDTPPPGRRLPKEEDSPHPWLATLPGGLAAGSQLIEPRSVDMWGREFIDRRVIRIE